MIWLMALALTAAAPVAANPPPKPTAQAEDLGLRLARANTFAAVAPVLAEQQVESVIVAHPEWKPEDAAFYRTTARRVAASDLNRIVLAIGHAYAERLSIADLQYLVAALESPAAARRRAVEPAALRSAMDKVGSIDFTQDTLRAFCAQMGKGCPAK